MSANRTQREAARQYVAGLQRSLSCITNSVLLRSQEETNLYAVALVGQPVRLPGSDIMLLISERFEINNGKLVRTEYFYEIARQDREILVFHWHPQGRSNHKTPHLHAALTDPDLSRKNHIPTGNINLEDIIRFLIFELGVRPLRQDWQQTIEPPTS